MTPALVEQLSPSQIVLLRGETVVRTWGRLKLPSGAWVSSRAMGETLIKVALLACATQGVLRLETQPRPILFGLGAIRELYAQPQATLVPWPESTLEAWLTHLALQLQPEKRNRVRSLVYVLLKQDSPNPWRRIVHQVQGGLVAMGILERMEETQTAKQKLPRIAETTADSISGLPTGPVQELLSTYQTKAPRIERLLRKEISRGIGYRRKYSEQGAT